MTKPPPATTAQFIQRSIQRSLRELPALPDAVLRVSDETNSAEPSILKIERYLSSDQALTAKVLRVVNSAYYGLSGQVSSIGQAVMILGMQQVRNLVLSVGAISLFEVPGPQRQETLKRFWLHSFSTALATQIVGDKKRFDRVTLESAFIAGLLHDVGRLFLFANFTRAYDQMIARAVHIGAPVEMVEWSLLGIGHADIGLQMAQYWKLPEQICEVIGRHEGPFDGTAKPIELCVHVADCLSKHLYYPGNSKLSFSLHPVAEDWLGCSPEEFEEIKNSLSSQMNDAADWLHQMAA
jgi:HD-like signal output (HDOD) protein